MTARPKVALVGAGTMGSLHARVLSQSDRVDFKFVVEQNAQTGQAIADRFGIEHTSSLDGLKDVDAVVIAAATEAHYAIAKQALELGKPLLIEKPLAATYAQSEELVAESEKRGLPLVCGFLERFNPAILTAKQFVGEVVQINAMRHSPFVPRIKTGVAGDLLIHDVDLAIRFVGNAPAAVKGSFGFFHKQSQDNGSEDSADATMSFESGALATISASRISQRKVRQISVLEIDRLIEIDLLRRDITIYKHVADSPAADGVGYQSQTVIELPTILQSAEPLAAQLNHFLNLLELGAGSDEVTAERNAILPAHKVVHEATLSATNGKA
ncbi:Gfo/Idh/MocA family oxidoreductase [Lentzea sp. BCCO 10_0061]|uniref:Gfo/Idh/MocA family oxidoreductase n=1 Tax=Lentzea sokolovensis TaxID=3095429 RepID=A0ABU4UXK9_9PSEU|nr:Gfo/Idh/MocA family oxidoreductase [Lentzea sp. BCCO 10_0061]MDX8143970.1 Gfo/Idh/MocA family oxidoreductase [Lentzea sp. BCCO 10_0061]